MACAAAAISGTLLLTAESNNPTKYRPQHSTTSCCGIAAVIGKPGSKQDARDFLVEGLTVLKNRGYDSAGIATIDVGSSNADSTRSGGNRLAITKYASNGDLADGIELVKENSYSSSGHHIGIAHTR
jgi:glucosamine--fructose-6-phosphate aminotransferase (isomerizing)